MTSDANIRIGNSYTDEQLKLLAPVAIRLADAAVSRERWKNEVNAERTRGDVRADTFLMSRSAYGDAKKRYREALRRYEEEKKAKGL